LTAALEAREFYVTGGTLPNGAPSYVERRSDEELYQALRRGEYCYLLTSRQMGKSSLMVRTAARLKGDGVTVVVLDLTAIGQNVTAEQWYDGLLNFVGRQVGLEDELDDFWLEHERLGPLQRFMAALAEVVLPGAQVSRHSGVQGKPPSEHPTPEHPSLVIFIDEIDAVRSLPFSTDEFFAAIRECYNRRTEDPLFQCLTFCLLGVASPADLIRDVRTTPFNIGRRIHLTDFTPEEALPLAAGFGRGARLGRQMLQRALYWTGGHPYLTQRLCQIVAGDRSAKGVPDVDRHCEATFLTHQARERDDNLIFVRERILRGGGDLASVLDLYRQVIRRPRPWRPRVADDPANPLVGSLRLSGLVRSVDGFLQVRNRIYQRVFDRAWITAHMPDAELRRQRRAYRKGLVRTSAVSGVIIAALSWLIIAERLQAQKVVTLEEHETDLLARITEQAVDQLRVQVESAPPSLTLTRALLVKEPRYGIGTAPKEEHLSARARLLLDVLRFDTSRRFRMVYYGDEWGHFTGAQRLGPALFRVDQRWGGPRDTRRRLFQVANDRWTELKQPIRDYDLHARPWYTGARERNGLYWTEPYLFHESRKPGITASVPLPGVGPTAGVLGVDFDLNTLLSGLVRRLSQDPAQRVFVLSDRGGVLARSDGLPALAVPRGELDVPQDPPLASEQPDVVLRTAWSRLVSRRDREPQHPRIDFVAGGGRYRAVWRPLAISRDLRWTVLMVVPKR
jgi:hypothetical protein